MASELTPERRAAIRARCVLATGGPWRQTGHVLDKKYTNVFAGVNPVAGTDWAADAEFVANARTDVPDLLAALDASEATVRDLTVGPDGARLRHPLDLMDDLRSLGADLDASEARIALTRGELDAAYEMASRLIAEKKALEAAGDRLAYLVLALVNGDSADTVSREAWEAWRALRGTGDDEA